MSDCVKLKKFFVGKEITLVANDADITGSVMCGWDDYTIKVKIKKGESNLVDKDGGKKWLIVHCNNGNINIDL